MLVMVMSLAMAMSAQDQDAAVTPGACRVSAERLIEASGRIRRSVESDTSDAPQRRASLLAVFEDDLATARRVLARTRDVAGDPAPLEGMRGSEQVDYMRRCEEMARLDALPARTPGLCKAAALYLLPLNVQVRASLMADARSARAGGTARYEEGTRTSMLAILDQDDTQASSIIARHQQVTPTAAETAEGAALSAPNRPIFLGACAAQVQ